MNKDELKERERDKNINRAALQIEIYEHFKSGIADKQKSFTSS